MKNDYLDSVKKELNYYKILGEKAMAQLPEEKLCWQYNRESNSIAIIVKHLRGNMLSRWTDFLTSDGEKEWRDRDGEFNNDIQDREGLLAEWNEGWKCLFDALDTMKAADLGKEVFIRIMGQTVLEAVNRQLAHYAYHTGQIVFIAKMICDSSWSSLSIPTGNSKVYNANKFEKPIHTEHFTDEFLKGQKE